MTGSERKMGEGIREIKTVGIAGRLKRRIEARIADAAAVIVHRLAGETATDAGRGPPGTLAALARQQILLRRQRECLSEFLSSRASPTILGKR